jgi:hypothetical protein
MLRVTKGALVPADITSQNMLRERGYRTGDVLAAELRKPRSPGYHRLAHAFGELCAENLDAFSGMNPHSVLKRLQIEAGIGCDEVALNFPGIGPCVYRVPQSLSFESMDQATFEGVFAGLCEHVARVYWPGLDADEVARMAEVMVQAA